MILILLKNEWLVDSVEIARKVAREQSNHQDALDFESPRNSFYKKELEVVTKEYSK